jgi:hypothetical protein
VAPNINRCIIKTVLFQETDNRMTLQSSILLPEILPQETMPNNQASHLNGPKVWKGARSKVVRPMTGLVEDKGIEFLTSRAIRELSPLDMVKPLRGWKLWAEYAYIFRPLLYGTFSDIHKWPHVAHSFESWQIVLTLKKYGFKSWKPWLLSLLVEYGSIFVTKGGLSKAENPWNDLTSLEKDEVRRRQRALVYYLLRNPVYDKFTKYFIPFKFKKDGKANSRMCRNVVDGVVSKTSKIPLISIFSGELSPFMRDINFSLKLKYNPGKNDSLYQRLSNVLGELLFLQEQRCLIFIFLQEIQK